MNASGGGCAERWLEPGTEYAKTLPLPKEWYQGLDLGGMDDKLLASSDITDHGTASCAFCFSSCRY